MIVQCTASALIIRSLPEGGVGTDTGKRIFNGYTATAAGESFDKEWLYIDAPAARGWAAKRFLEELSANVLPSPAWPKIPNGRAEIEAVFGKPGKPICSAGRVLLPTPVKLSWSDQKVTIVSCHKLMEDVFTSVFNAIYKAGLWPELENYGGIYEDRSVKGGLKISTHAWGISVDVDTLDNALGKKPEMHPKIIKIFADHGFLWGGNWNRPDGMHFQYARGY